MKLSSYNIIDLFCGTGGFAHGFESYSDKFKVVCAVDILKQATNTAKANHKDCLIINDDIRNIRPSFVSNKLDNANIDLIVGGPPCQGFSSLRPFRSSDKDDPRNSLFEQFALYVNYFRPKVFVLENVVGLLTHKNGKTLKSIEECFSGINYKTDWKIMNAAHYGVPQKRERFVLIGIKDDYRIEFPEPTHFFEGRIIGHKDKRRMLVSDRELKPAVTLGEAISDLTPIKSGESSDRYYCDPLNDYQRNRRNGSSMVTMHESAKHSDKMLEIIKYSGDNINCIPKHLITSGFSSCYSRLRNDEPATTLTVKFQSPASSKCIHPSQDRALTAREGARIQSFDDSYIFEGSKTGIISMLGNAVPPLLGTAIARSIIKILDN